MKKLLTLLILAAALVGCQSETYYAAQSINDRRFGGWQRENADFLAKAYDLTLTIQSLANLGTEETRLKETFIRSTELTAEIEKLKLEIHLEATKRRVKIASAMSRENDAYCQLLKDNIGENFDFVWTNALNTKVEELIALSSAYAQSGSSENLKEFAKLTAFKVRDWSIETEKSVVTE